MFGVPTAGWPARLARLAGWRADLAALALGGLAALALPPVHLVPILLICLPGLSLLLDATTTQAEAGRRGWWFGFGLNVAGLYWITEAVLFEASRYWWLVPLAVPALAAVLAVFIALPAWLARYARPGFRRLVAFAAAWTLLDIARQFVATGFPWNPLGSVWTIPGVVGNVMIQPAAWVGVHGLTLMTLLLALAPRLRRPGWFGALAGLVLWAGGGLWRLAEAEPAGPDLAVVLVQGNVPQGEKWSRDRAVGIFQRYLELTHAAVRDLGDRAAVVVWPETASPFLLESDLAARQAISDAADGQPVLAGGIRFGSEGRPRNAVFALLSNGLTAAIYDKWHLVPFGEYQPSWMPLAIQLVPGGGFMPGPGARTLHIPGVPPVGVLICYETIFPAQVVAAGDRPAWLANVTNDAWFGNSSGPRQHLTSSRLRSVEEGLPLVRVANTGISAVFDARGRELGRISLNVTGTRVIPLPGARPATVFSWLGLWGPAMLSVLGIAYGLASLRRRGIHD